MGVRGSMVGRLWMAGCLSMGCRLSRVGHRPMAGLHRGVHTVACRRGRPPSPRTVMFRIELLLLGDKRLLRALSRVAPPRTSDLDGDDLSVVGDPRIVDGETEVEILLVPLERECAPIFDRHEHESIPILLATGTDLTAPTEDRRFRYFVSGCSGARAADGCDPERCRGSGRLEDPSSAERRFRSWLVVGRVSRFHENTLLRTIIVRRYVPRSKGRPTWTGRSHPGLCWEPEPCGQRP